MKILSGLLPLVLFFTSIPSVLMQRDLSLDIKLASAQTDAPLIISHQGRLLDASGNLLGGVGTDYCFKFSIYDNATVGLGVKLWPAGAPSTMTVEVKNGVYNVGIGDTSAGGDALTFDFQDDDAVYVNIEVGAEVAGSCVGASFENLSPRQRILSSGYAINANTLGGFAASQTPTGSQIPVLTAGVLSLAGNIDTGGVIQAGSSNVNITLATGMIDADALTLYAGGDGGSATTSSATGLEKVSDGLTLLQGCSNNEILKWNEATDLWACNTDISGGGGGTLQDAYDNGAAINTSDANDIDIELADDTTDSNLDIDIYADNTVAITRTASASAEIPNQLLLLENADADILLTNGLLIQSNGGAITDGIEITNTNGNITTGINLSDTAGGTFATGLLVSGTVTTAIDLSNASIGTGISLGGNDITGTSASIDFDEFDVSGSTGAITINDGGDAGNISIEGTILDINSLDFVGAGTITSAASGDITINGADEFIVSDNSTFNGTVAFGSTTTFQASDIQDAEVSDTLTSSLFVGSGSTTNAIDLATAEVAGTLPVGNGGTGATSLADLITLATHTSGNFVASVTNGSGISGGDGGSEGAALTLALGALTSDWNQSGAFDISLNNASSELKILESTGATFYGIFDVTDLSASDKTYTFPNASGTVITTGNITDITGLTDSQISDTLTASNFVGSGSSTTAVDLGTAEVSGTLGVGNGGTGATSLTDLITLGTHTQGNYVANVATDALTGLTGGSAGSEGAGLTVALDYSQALSGNVGLAANAAVFGQSGLVFEGSAADNIETFFSVTNPTTTDKTITFPDATITVNAAADISGTTLAANVVTSSLTTVGVLNAGSITSGFGSIDVGTDAITTTGTITGGNVTVNSGSLTVGGEAINDLTGTGISISGSALQTTLGVAIDTSEITDNTITADDLSATLTFIDGDLVNFAAINTSGTGEGLILPQATSCSAGTAEGQICWDTDNDFLSLGTNGGVVSILSSGTTLFTLAGDSGTSSLTSGDTITVAGGAGLTSAVAGDTATVTVGAGNGITVNANDIAVNPDYSFAWTNSQSWTLAGTESLTVTSTPAGTNAVDVFALTLTNQTSSGTQRALVLTNANDAANATTEAVISIDNAETTAATLTDAIRVTSSGAAGGIIDAIDVSDSNIDNAINIGTNNIVTGATTIASTELDVLDGGISIATEISGLGTGVATFLGTPSSANLITAITDETGSGSLVFGTSPTLTTPRIADLGYIADSSGNELLVFDSNATAVNQLTIANSAAGNGLTIAATGDDTDVALSIDAKGAGAINIGNTSTGNILLGGGSSSTGCTLTNSSGAFACSGALTGSNLSGTNTGDQTITLTGDVTGSGTGSFAATIAADSVALTTDTTGNYVQSITNGSGISGGNGGSEGAALTLALGALTADWNQTGAFDITLNNASSEINILESAGDTFFGTIDVTNLSANRIYTFPDAAITVNAAADISGTTLASNVVTSSLTTVGTLGSLTVSGAIAANGGITNDDATFTINAGGTVNVQDNLTVDGDLTITGDDLFMTTNSSGFILVADGTNYNPVDVTGDIDIATNGAVTIQANSVALGTDTTNDYVASFTAGTGLTGDATGEGSTPTLSVNTSAGITTSSDNIILDLNYNPTWTNSHAWTLTDGEVLSVTSTSNSDTSIQSLSATQADDGDATDDLYAFDLSLVNQSGDAGDTVTGLRIRVLNDAANQTTDTLISLDNEETSAAVTAGILFGNTGTITTAIDASASNIGTALSVGANDIVGTTGLINYTNFDVDASGNVILAGDLTVTGNDIVGSGGTAITFSGVNTTLAGDLTVSGGNITNGVTFDAGLTVAAAQTITIGGDAIDEFVGTGLQLSSGDLQTTLGVAIDSGEITDNTITADDLSATLTFIDGDLITLAAINSSSATEGLILPQNATACSAATGEGQICWDTAGEDLYVGNGSAAVQINGAASVTLQQAYDAGNTITTDATGNVAIVLAELGSPTSFTIENQDTAGTSAQYINNSIASGTLTNGLYIEQTGAGTMTNAIQIDETAGAITDGILITGTLGNILNSGSIDITGSGAITGATGVTSATGNITATAGNLVATAGDLVFGATTRITNAGVGTFITGTVIGSQTFTTNNITDSGALTIASGGAGALTLDSASNVLVMAANDTTLQRTASGTYTINLVDGANTTLAVTNSGAGTASITADGNISATGTVTGSNLSGTNTGDQTITLTGDVTGSGTGSFAATIAANSVALGTDTTNDYVASFTAGTGLTGDATGEGSTPTLSVNTSAGITTSSDNIILDLNYNPTWTNSHAWTLTDGEVLSVTSTSNSDTSIQSLSATQADDGDATDDLYAFDLSLVNQSGDAGDTVTGLRIRVLNDAANQTTDTLISLDNEETSAAVTAGILFGNTGTITTAIDASASNIGTALSVGANDIVGTTGLINYTNFDVDASGNVILAGDLTVTGNDIVGSGGTAITFSGVNTTLAGDLTVSGGNITNGVTFDAGLTVAAAQTITIGGDAIDEFVGTGLQLSSGDLQTTLGVAIDSGEITDNTITADDLSATLTFIDGDLITLAAINSSSATEGLILPQNATACSAATGEGQICWDTAGEDLYVGNGSAAVQINGAASVTLQQAYDAGNTITTDATGNVAIVLAELGSPTSFTIENQDTAGTSAQYINNSIASGTLTNGLYIEQTGAGTMTNAIQIDETAGAITDGILITGTLGNILNSGSIDITGSGAITGATGVTSATGNITATAGNLVATAGDLVFGATTRITNAGVGTFITGTVIGSQTFTTNNITDSGALTIASGGAGALTLDSASNVLVMAANDTTLQRTASGTYTINLVDGANTTLAVTNSGAGTASITADGNISATGTVTGSNLSGTNTGDQTITLTGDVTGSGTGSFAATIAANSVALGTDTTNDYVASFTAGTGLTGDATGEGSTPTLSVNTSAGITTSSDNIILDLNYNPTWTNSHAWTLTDGEVLSVTSTSNSDTSIQSLSATQADDGDATDDLYAFDLSLVNQSGDAGDTVTGLRIRVLNDAANQTTDTLISLDNEETSAAVTAGILFGNTGTITTAIDASASNIVTALSVGANTILGTTGDINFDNFDVTGSNGNIVTAGTLAVNGDSITADGATLTINAGGNADIQDALNADNITTDTGGVSIAAGQSYTGAGTVTLSSAAASALTINSGTTGTIAIGDDASNETINIGTGGAVKGVTLGSTNTTSSTIIQSGSGAVQLQSNGTGTGNVYIGDTSATGTPDLLVVGMKSTAGNPTAVEGAVYYNADADKFYIAENVLGTPTWKEICNKTDAACGAGSGSAWSALSVPGGNLTLAMDADTTTFNWTSTGALNAWTYGLSNTSSSATTQNLVSINNSQVDSADTDNATENLLLLQQLDTSTGDSNVVSNFITIDVAGNAGATDGIEITNSAGNLTNGINIADTAGGTLTTGILVSGSVTTGVDLSDSNIGTGLSLGANDITGTTAVINFTNFDVDSAGSVVAVGVNSGSGLLQGTGGITVTGTAQINASGSGATTIGNASAGALALQGSTATLTSTGAGNDITLTSADQIILNSGGTIELQDNTNITGALTVSGAITNATSYNGLVITANTGTITTGVWQGTAVTDTYVADTLTLGSGSSVHWDALNNYPAACSAGSAISALADTTNTCTSFNTDTSITLQDAYDATSGNSITATDARNLAITLANTATDPNFTITTAAGGAGFTTFSLADGTNTTPPSQLILIDNTDTTEALGIGLKVQSAAGTITTAIDVSDAEIGTALAIGLNDITTGATTISSAELDRLDGKDAALVDTNDVVNTAITGTGALNSGSITSGFGTIDIGADTITSGAINGQTISATASFTGSVAIAGAVTNATSYNGLVITANTGTITTGVWQGTAVTDTYVADTLTLGSASSVHWDALNNYPAACSAGSAISALADTTNTCTSFNTDTSITLQDAYDATSGNSITATDARNLAITLANTATDPNFTITTAAGGAGFTTFSLADGTNTAPPSQLILIDNTDTTEALGIGLKVQSAAGTITTAIDVSDAEIGTALAIGSNDITTGATTISSAELDRLDGKDAALVDTNDAVSTAITGTGALNSGSITSGFGTIDIGADTITSGAINGQTISATASFTGSVAIAGAVTNATSYNGLVITANTGTITTGVWQGTAVTDTYVADTLTLGSASSVHWDALNNYPAACSAGSAISALADTTNTCTAFNTDTSITLQDAYDTGNTITTDATGNVAIVLAELGSPTSFTIENQDTAGTSAQYINNSIASGTLTNGLYIEQIGAGTMTNAIQIAETAGAITTGILFTGGVATGIDLTDSSVGTGLSLGANDITGTTAVINFTNFDVDSAGSVVAVGVNSGSGLLQGTGGITVTGTAQINASGSGATTIGNASAGALALQGSTATLTSTGAGNDITLTSADQIILNSGGTIELQDNTNVTGALTATGVLQGGGATAAAYSRLGSGTAGNLDAADDLLVSDELEVDGVAYFDGTIDTTFTAGSVVFAGTNGVLAQDNAGLFYDSATDELGIGNASPAYSLSVHDGSEAAVSFTTSGSGVGSSDGLYIGYTTSGATSYIWNYENGPISFGTNGANVMGLTALGNFNLASSAGEQNSRFYISGNLSSTSWTTAGRLLQLAAATYTDTSGSGTIASRVASSFAQPTFASTNPVTVTDGATLYVANAPANGSNTTITNPYALWIDDGASRFDGAVSVAGLFTGTLGATIAGATTSINDSSNFATNINTGTSTGTVTIGSTTTTQAILLQSGTGDLTLTSTDDFIFTATDDITLNGGSAGSIIALGTNTNGNVINIGTDNTTSDTITIGSALDNVAITGDQWSIDASGVLTVASCTGCGGGASSLQDAYDGGNTILTASATDIAFTFAADTALTLDAATTDTTETTGVVDINVDSATDLASAIDIFFRSTGTTSSATNYIAKIGYDPEHATNARTTRLLDIDVSGDSGTLADIIYGAYIDVTTATNTSDTTYAAVFQGGNVGIGDTSPGAMLEINTRSATTTGLIISGFAGQDNNNPLLQLTATPGSAVLGLFDANGRMYLNAGALASFGPNDLDVALALSPRTSSTNAQIIRAVASHSGNIFEIQDDSTNPNFGVTAAGAVTADGLITGNLGSTIAGATTSLNASSNFATNINTGTSTGTVTIGSTTTTQAILLQSGTGDLTLTSTDDFIFTATDDITLNGGSAGSIIALGTNTQGNVINIGTDNTTSDTITIGSALDNVAITGDQWSITDAGALTVVSCSGCGGGSQTPWTSAIDADGFALQDALNLEFRTAAGSAPGGTVISLYADNSGDLTANVLNGKTFNIAENGSDEYNFSDTAIAMNSNNITGLGTALTAAAGLTVTATSADLALVTATSGNITLAPASTGSVQITSGTTTGTTTTSAVSTVANSLTSGTVMYLASSNAGQTSAKFIDIAQTGVTTGYTGNLINLSSTSTTGAATFINLTADSSTVGTGQAISMAALTTGKALSITAGGATALTSGQGLLVTGPTGAAAISADSGLVKITAAGAMTTTTGAGSGGLLNVQGNAMITGTLASISDTAVMTTTGNLLTLVANAATTTTGLLTQSATGLTTGYIQSATLGTALTTGGAANISGASYLHTGTETGSVMKIAYTDASSNGSGTATTNGILLQPTIATTASAGAKIINGISISPTHTSCGTTAGTCTFNGYDVTTASATQTTTNTYNIRGINLGTAGALTQNTAAGTINWTGLNLQMPNLTETTGTIAAYGINITGGTPDKGSVNTAINITNTTLNQGVTGVAGILGAYTLTNATDDSQFQYGNRFVNTISSASGIDSTYIGEFIRMIDNDCSATDCANNTRGLEVQAYSGTNNAGINTGILTYGKTFGIYGVTTSQASTVSQPAAVFADLDNGTDSGTKALGNAIRAYTNDATSADLVSVYQETSAYTGNGLIMDFGNGGGSFSGNFINLKEGGTSRFTFADTGRMDILTPNGDNAIALYLNSEESTDSQSVFALESDTTNNSQSADAVKAHFEADGSLFVSLTGTETTVALCHATAGKANNDEIVDCSGAPSDVAEYFGTTDPTIVAADVVVAGQEAEAIYLDGYHTSKAWVKKSSQPYQSNLLGVVSTAPAAVYGDEIFSANENPRPVALVGRVPVKVTSENGLVQAGDYLTSSSLPGYAMKSTRPGMVLGQALSSDDGSGVVIVFVNPFFYDPTIFVDANGNVNLQRNTATTTLTASTTTTAAQVIDQQGSGDILQLQSAGENKFFVQNSGQVNIHTGAFGTEDKLLVITTNNETEVFNIDARGFATITGLLVVKDDSYAGSITTLQDGTAEITFTYDLGTGKPVVQLTPEGDTPVFAQILEWKKDDQERYTGFVIKTFSIGGSSVQATVHYLVTAKQEGYETFGEILEVSSQPQDGDGDIIVEGSGGDENITPEGDSGGSGGEVAGDSTSGNGDGVSSDPDPNSDPEPTEGGDEPSPESDPLVQGDPVPLTE